MFSETLQTRASISPSAYRRASRFEFRTLAPDRKPAGAGLVPEPEHRIDLRVSLPPRRFLRSCRGGSRFHGAPFRHFPFSG